MGLRLCLGGAGMDAEKSDERQPYCEQLVVEASAFRGHVPCG